MAALLVGRIHQCLTLFARLLTYSEKRSHVDVKFGRIFCHQWMGTRCVHVE